MSKLIGEIEKNQKERIRIFIDEYRGHKFCNVRVFFEADNGQWLPTKKGITFNDETIDEVIPLLQKASKELEGE
ncbi:MAG: transcriptional coactivator p15/PC4 family protein [Proteobacteria bacterium]|nr:transcriptional coactivator p15/PC4 family protein [Pseudomonadota bacterium]